MMTPEQIADAAIRDTWMENLGARDRGNIRSGMIAAVRADRAQRAADLAVLADAAAYWSTELTDYIIPGSEDAKDPDSVESQTAERDAIQAALERYQDSKEQ